MTYGQIDQEICRVVYGTKNEKNQEHFQKKYPFSVFEEFSVKDKLIGKGKEKTGEFEGETGKWRGQPEINFGLSFSPPRYSCSCEPKYCGDN